ncbi:MAG: glucose-6-phosphate isomerase [Planctomycetota bacterium]|jgi:glucose-6-phosphate isomerase
MDSTLRLDLTGCVGGGRLGPAFDDAGKGLPARIAQERAQGRHGYLDLEAGFAAAEGFAGFVEQARGRFRRLVQCGIGGSTMGNRAVHAALPGDREVRVIDNVDPSLFEGLEGSVLDDTLVHVVTKSGGTAETLAMFLLLAQRLRERRPGAWREHVCVTTDPGPNALRRFCEAEGIRVFALPTPIGGRFSYFTPVGLFSLAFAGRSPQRMLEGARMAREAGLREGSAALAYGCAIHALTKQGLSQAVFFTYGDSLGPLGRWWQQLLAESLGKARTRGGVLRPVGPVPVLAEGTRDQHSLLQLFMEGAHERWFTFVDVEGQEPSDLPIPAIFPDEPLFQSLQGTSLLGLLGAARRGVSHALRQAGRPVAGLTLPALDEASLGGVMMTLMLAVTYAGELFEIDAYDQPGVEQGKVATRALLGGDSAERSAVEDALRPDPRWCFSVA